MVILTFMEPPKKPISTFPPSRCKPHRWGPAQHRGIFSSSKKMEDETWGNYWLSWFYGDVVVFLFWFYGDFVVIYADIMVISWRAHGNQQNKCPMAMGNEIFFWDQLPV